MRGLAAFVLSGRTRAVLVAVGFAILSLLLPPVGYLGAAVVGLVTLRSGAIEGLLVGAGASLAAGVLSTVALGTAFPVVALIALLWLPVWALAQVLRRVPSQGVTLSLGAFAALGAVLLAYALPGSPAERWQGLLEETLVPAFAAQGVTLDPEVVTRLAEVMTGVVAAAALLGASVSLFIARWWQATLFNPGGFGTEFRALRADRRLAVGTLVVLAGLLVLGGEPRRLAAELMLVALVVFSLQGLAVAHGLLAGRRQAGLSLGALYVAVVLLWPYPLLVLGAVGLVDTWVDFRTRQRPSAGPPAQSGDP
jgi:hypothetical protein